MNTPSHSTNRRIFAYASGCLLALASGVMAQEFDIWKEGKFSWKANAPLIDVEAWRSETDGHVALKDPTIVFHEGRWHVIATLRRKSGRVCMQYFNFAEWKDANTAPRTDISFTDQYHSAPTLFYFTPHQRWYLVYQLSDPARTPKFGPYYSTTKNLADPASWSRPQPMVENAPEKPKWLDFWVICDNAKAHLFYTSLNGQMWRRETKLADFPHGWSEPVLALKADIFEASHTYRLQGRDEYLTIVEAQAPNRRYYKAYVADRLEGPWKGLADSLANPFAARENVRQSPEWTASFSHGELLRSGVNERMEVDPARLRFFFQGVSEEDYRETKYGGIPWKLGLLEQDP